MPPHRRLLAAAAAVLVATALTACAPDGPTDGQGEPTSSPSTSGSPEPSSTPTASPTATPAAVPTDCEAILSDDVLAQLEGIPLNDPVWDPTGVLDDGSLRCIWAHPSADTTGLMTTISVMARGPALDMLNEVAAEHDYTCYTPDGGTRCEATWQNSTYGVTDGRTLFWRDDIMIDTAYSNLTIEGYTSSIVEHIWG